MPLWIGVLVGKAAGEHLEEQPGPGDPRDGNEWCSYRRLDGRIIPIIMVPAALFRPATVSSPHDRRLPPLRSL